MQKWFANNKNEEEPAAPLVVEEDETAVTVPREAWALEDTQKILAGRPAAEPAAAEPMIQVVRRSHLGAVRERNEDSCLAFVSLTGGQEPLPPLGLFVVADGMGGHQAGHEASRLVSRLVGAHVLSRLYLPLLQNPAAPPHPVQEVMVEAVQQAHLGLQQSDPGRDSGTTLTAALMVGRRLYLAHVGDSRAYLLSDGLMELLTTDHSHVRRLQDSGQLTDEEAAVHPYRNILYRAVGQGSELEVDTFTRSLPATGRLLLCSDGLWGLLTADLLEKIARQSGPLAEVADELVDAAIAAGGHDNVTAVLVDFAF
ncbi:MAG: protein phosphatase 2C domain-containing protein [Chloroflexota bacterium]